MTWDLRKSRSMFFSETGESPRESFWVRERDRLRETGDEAVDLGALLEWNPSAPDARSNCPALHETISELVSLVDDRWRARAGNIYAGRTSGGTDLAFSRHAHKGGVVVLSTELSMSLIAYVNLWARFLALLDMFIDTSPDVWKATEHGIRNDFAKLMKAFQGEGLAALLGQWPLTFMSESHSAAAAEHVESAERWIIAHELSHHILRHASGRPDLLAKRTIEDSLQSEQLACELLGMTAQQREEIEADVLAFELIAGEYAKDTSAIAVLQAYQGACMALVAVGHLRSDWLAKSTDSHPGILDRLVVLTKWTLVRYAHLVQELLDEMPGERRLHRLAASLTSFALWASGVSPEVVRINTSLEADAIHGPVTMTNYLQLAVMLGDLDSYGATKLLLQHDAR